MVICLHSAVFRRKHLHRMQTNPQKTPGVTQKQIYPLHERKGSGNAYYVYNKYQQLLYFHKKYIVVLVSDIY